MPGLTSNLYRFGDFSLDVQNRVLKRGQFLVPLTSKAFDLLLVLARSGGEIVTKDELMRSVWPDSFVGESNLTQTVFMLRKALGETRDQRYILTVQGEGYRFAVGVSEVSNESMAEAIPPNPDVTDLQTQRRRFRLIAAGLALVLIAAAVWSGWLRNHVSQPPNRIMLAVLPFENLTGDAEQEYTSDGLTEEMISQLGNLDPQHLGVIARTSVMHYKGSRTPLEQIGRELGVQYVIEGSVRRESDRVRISAQLIQLRDQSHVWARQYDRELKGLLTVEAEIAHEVADEIQFTIGDQTKINTTHHIAASSTGSYEAYDLYLKGLYFWNQRTAEGFREAAEYFQQAIAKDPNYAPAYAGLAYTLGLTSTWSFGPQNELMPKARDAALKALQLDDMLGDAHTALALVAENYDYDWTKAEREFRRAIQLNSGDATTHQWYAEYLSWQGRFDEALAESEEARKLDPLSLIIATDHGSILYFSRQYDRAIAQLQTVLDRDPNFGRARALLMLAEVEDHRLAEALTETNHFSNPPWVWAARAYVYGRWGRTAEAEHAFMKSQESPGSRGSTQSQLIALIGAGKKEEAIILLQKAYDGHGNVVALLKVDPMFDPLRSDPRFQDLLRRLRLGG